jgi:hypothetical protein
VSAAGAGMLGTFLPWVSAGIITVSGTSGDGWITLALFGVALLLSVLGRRSEAIGAGARVAKIVCALVAAWAGLYDASGAPSIGVIGPGLFLVILAAGVVGVTASFGARRWPAVVGGVLAAILVASGFVHVAYNGDQSTPFPCAKGRWSLRDTLVDLDDFIGHQTKPGGESEVDALIACGVLNPVYQATQATQPSEPTSYGRCVLDGEAGSCVRVNECSGRHAPGYCVGPDYIQCCVQR